MSPYRIARKLRVGRRGLSLLLLSGIYLLSGVSLCTARDLPSTSQRSLGLALAIAPLWVWGIMWLVGAAVAAVTAWWPPGADGFGFGALTGISVLWSCVFAAGAIVHHEPRAWTGCLAWLAITALLQIIAGWPEVPSHVVEASADE